MNNATNLSGQRFGRLTVTHRLPSKQFTGGRTKSVYAVTCDCGNKREVYAQHLRNGRTQSCGCLAKELIASRSSKIETIDHWKTERDRAQAEVERQRTALQKSEARLAELLTMIA